MLQIPQAKLQKSARETQFVVIQTLAARQHFVKTDFVLIFWDYILKKTIFCNISRCFWYYRVLPMNSVMTNLIWLWLAMEQKCLWSKGQFSLNWLQRMFYTKLETRWSSFYYIPVKVCVGSPECLTVRLTASSLLPLHGELIVWSHE